MLDELRVATHTVVSGLCLLGPGGDVVAHELTDVTFRPFTPATSGVRRERGVGGARRRLRDPGLGARLVERIEGDYLNVVGLPGALLLSLSPPRCSTKAIRPKLPRQKSLLAVDSRAPMSWFK